MPFPNAALDQPINAEMDHRETGADRRKVDKRFYAVKGGCNPRIFLKSFRYSEDMDMDVQNISKEKLEETVSDLLDSAPFRDILRARGIAIDRWSAPKQSETTQRWKLGLAVPASDVLRHTKLEFCPSVVVYPSRISSSVGLRTRMGRCCAQRCRRPQ